MQRFNKVSQNAFSGFVLDAGILMRHFDLETGTFDDKDIVCTTTGGITITCKPDTSDFGSDIDNVPNRMKEFIRINGWECGFSTTALDITEEGLKLALGAADQDAVTGAIRPRGHVKQSDFRDLWWGANKANGGFAVVRLKNAFSMEGLSIKTTKNGKAQISLSFNGHASIKNQSEMPMEFYVREPETEFSVTADSGIQNGSVSFKIDGLSVTKATVGDTVTVQATPESGYTVKRISAVDGDGNVVFVDWKQEFVMPDSNVTVSAEFEEEA